MQPGRSGDHHRQPESEREHALVRQRGVDHLAHGLAVHVLHCEEVGAVVAADVEHLRDVLVVERRDQPGLVEKHRNERVVLDVRGA